MAYLYMVFAMRGIPIHIHKVTFTQLLFALYSLTKEKSTLQNILITNHNNFSLFEVQFL